MSAVVLEHLGLCAYKMLAYHSAVRNLLIALQTIAVAYTEDVETDGRTSYFHPVNIANRAGKVV